MTKLFVYGTLRPGGHNYPLLQGWTLFEEPAVADGLALYGNASGTFPYAIIQPGRAVWGTLCTIADRQWPVVRHRLDLLEGFHPRLLDHSHYVRRRWPVRATSTHGFTSNNGSAPTNSSTLTKGSDRHSTIAWLYLAAPGVRVDRSRLVASGDWLNR